MVRPCFLLVSYDYETYIPLDIGFQAVTPLWPPNVAPMIINDGVYELRAVPTTSISLVTDCVVKV
jgi:antiviral helicase SKI2